ncbi:MAG: response regulator transcription factor [Anaerolineae bacterium]|nr:response regulator transcription factor [Anaerolineae bacterium]MCA9890701.1 response regulator transcription factor [Anaerolineae bacterium]MCA9894580.1 response regulator transcription factor [Anaerolineae bacterium]MCB9460579.1 response regulator transcription factor [Anaerolineaceae bacterium]
MKTILIVDDKMSAQRLVADYLTANHYRTVTANNGRDALFVARHEKPDLVLLDIMMPEMDGFEFMRHFRKEHDTPVIMLTAKVEETDKVIGLELGADDYVTKPFGLAELLARIRANLRRVGGHSAASDVLAAGDAVLDRSSHEVSIKGKRIDLTPSEFDLMSIFMSAPGQVFSRADLLERLKGNSFENVERTVDVHVRNLRAKIEPDPGNPQYILTVFGVGYRFNRDWDTIA